MKKIIRRGKIKIEKGDRKLESKKEYQEGKEQSNMNIEKIKKASTKVIGKEILYYDVLDSTQKEAKRRIRQNNIVNGTIILTNHQTEGIGTKGRIWYTTSHTNITMTLVFFPNCDIRELEGLTIKIAEVIKNAIQNRYGISLQIKQPNDLLLSGKKIGGILTESSTYQEKVKYLLIGIGFNVNQTDFGREIEGIATSLKKEYRKEYNREDIIVAFIEEIEKLLV